MARRALAAAPRSAALLAFAALLTGLAAAAGCASRSAAPGAAGAPATTAREDGAAAASAEPAGASGPMGQAAANAGSAVASYAAIVDAPDRAQEDRALDAGRHPARTLAFLGLRPGMRVAELGAGRGYTTELLARAVAPTGIVFAQNSAGFLKFVGDAWAKRLEKPALRDVVRVDREFDDPLPPDARDLDLVLVNAVYHDLVWAKADRARMNRAVLAALKPGGAYVVIDSSAKPGTGAADAQRLHRIDEALVKGEVEAAGFRLGASGDFLRNPTDTRDWSSSPTAAGERRGTSDRFALRFVKP